MSEPEFVPETWKQKVRDILRTGDENRIRVRGRARQDWAMMFPDHYDYPLLDALIEALEKPDLVGRQVHTMEEPGEVYEFIFDYRKRRVYSKINLSPDGEVVIVYSAHRPLKGDHL